VVEKQSYKHGTFSWVDLSTTDQAAGKSFYQELFGWDAEDIPVSEGVFYTMFSIEGKNVAALSELQAEMKTQGVPSHWNSYITVDSADDMAAKAKELGANVMMDPFDVFDSGRMTVIQDPHSATFSIWEPKNHIGAQLVNDHNTFCWNELATRNAEESKAFYTKLFGWGTDIMETPQGPYHLLKNGEDMNGGIMQMTEEWGDMPPHWSVYFSVADCDGAANKIKELGGNVHHGPFDAPNIGRIAAVADPQGASFYIMTFATPPS